MESPCLGSSERHKQEAPWELRGGGESGKVGQTGFTQGGREKRTGLGGSKWRGGESPGALGEQDRAIRPVQRLWDYRLIEVVEVVGLGQLLGGGSLIPWSIGSFVL